MPGSISTTFLCFILWACTMTPQREIASDDQIIPAAASPGEYLHLIGNKKVGLVVNHTSLADTLHLLDFLLQNKVNVVKIFAPEHGFRGKADAGELVSDTRDQKTGLPIVSLYGSNKKPKSEDLREVDLMIFDIQDVGARFYTYISTMHYVMEACAENGKPLIILDRPNPNGFYVDGPVLKKEYSSFVGMHPIPVVHGLTVGELALMINGEGWLTGGQKCEVTVVRVQNYDHTRRYSLPVSPSPNLPNDKSINLYPSLCFFEGTEISLGRGTEFPFQVIGYPDKKFGDFSFKPVSIEGKAKYPPHENKVCYGKDLRQEEELDSISLRYLIGFYQKWDSEKPFFNNFFDKLAGTDALRLQVLEGKSEAEIRASWKADLDRYKTMRKKYLLYQDFE